MFNVKVGDQIRIRSLEPWYVVVSVSAESTGIMLRRRGDALGLDDFWCDKYTITDWINGKPEPAEMAINARGNMVDGEHGDGSRWEEL